jgi:hypothetical protein
MLIFQVTVEQVQAAKSGRTLRTNKPPIFDMTLFVALALIVTNEPRRTDRGFSGGLEARIMEAAHQYPHLYGL